MILKAAILATIFTIIPVEPEEAVPAETVTITVELAEKLVQQSYAQQREIDELKGLVYQYQMALYDARTKMCA